jgi:hypothetical protein
MLPEGFTVEDTGKAVAKDKQSADVVGDIVGGKGIHETISSFLQSRRKSEI